VDINDRPSAPLSAWSSAMTYPTSRRRPAPIPARTRRHAQTHDTHGLQASDSCPCCPPARLAPFIISCAPVYHNVHTSASLLPALGVVAMSRFSAGSWFAQTSDGTVMLLTSLAIGQRLLARSGIRRDRLKTMMLLLMAVLALFVAVLRHRPQNGMNAAQHFHVLFQFQLMAHPRGTFPTGTCSTSSYSSRCC